MKNAEKRKNNNGRNPIVVIAALIKYQQQANSIDKNMYDDILNSAVDYNTELAKMTPYITELTEARRKEYESILDITGNGVMGYIVIDKINISLPIYHGTSEAVLSSGAGHIEGSSLPVGGESVLSVISAHCGIPTARLFTDLDQLVEGDTFEIHILNEVLTYEVGEIQVLEPEMLQSLHVEEGKDICCLMTCTPYGINTHRLFIKAYRTETPAGSSSHVNTIFNTGIEQKNLQEDIVLIAAIVSVFVVSAIFILITKNTNTNTKKNSKNGTKRSTKHTVN